MSNEQKFEALRDQIAEMKKRQRDMEPLLELVAKREEIKAEEEDYLRLQKDPNRLVEKGREEEKRK